MAKKIDGLEIESQDAEFGVEFIGTDDETWQTACSDEGEAALLATMLSGDVVVRAHFVSAWALLADDAA